MSMLMKKQIKIIFRGVGAQEGVSPVLMVCLVKAQKVLTPPVSVFPERLIVHLTFLYKNFSR